MLCLRVPHAHLSSVTPRFEVSEILFLLLVVEGGRSQNLGLLRGPPKACAWPKQGPQQWCWPCHSDLFLSRERKSFAVNFFLPPPPATPGEFNL